jgi:patatin-like phospholipase/acyl hydrolase
MPFQILALSGGGYRGLFTSSILARLEQQAQRPIGDCFDLITGTSIGGVIAIGLALGKSAESIKKMFLDHGEEIFTRGEQPRGWWARAKEKKRQWGQPKYDGTVLREKIEVVVGKKHSAR